MPGKPLVKKLILVTLFLYKFHIVSALQTQCGWTHYKTLKIQVRITFSPRSFSGRVPTCHKNTVHNNSFFQILHIQQYRENGLFSPP